MREIEAKIFQEEHMQGKMVTLSCFDKTMCKEIGITHEQIDEVVNYLGCAYTSLYYHVGSLFNNFYYMNDYLIIELYSLDVEQMKMTKVKERIDYQTLRMKSCIEEADYVTLFDFMDKRLLFKSFEELYEEIPITQKYDVFTTIYVRSEYGFDELEEGFLEDVFEARKFSQDYKKRIEALNLLTWGENELTVYRGVGTKSQPIDKAYSWTLDRGTALFFANRFNENGELYEAKVNKENVIDYLSGRNEEEVLIHPKHIKNATLQGE